MHDKDTLKNPLKRLQVNPETRKDLAQNRPAWRREMKTGAAIYKANWIVAAKAKREAQRSQVPRLLTVNSQTLPRCPRCRRAFRVRIGPGGRLRTLCANDPTSLPPLQLLPLPLTPCRPPPSSPPIARRCPAATICTTPIPASIAAVSTTTTMSSRTPPPADGTTADFSSTSNVINTPTSSNVDSVHSCPHSDRTFTSHFGLIKKKLDGLYQDSFPEVAEALLSDLRQAIYELWNDLMGNEVSLVDQLEEIITDFGRNMSEMVSGFTESVQVCFSKIRESAASFNERLAEMTLTYAERLAKTEQQQQKSDHEASIYLDRDNLVNALNNSKEVHVAVIDKCEENVNKNLKQWLENLIEDLHQKEEYERHTNRVIEINMFIDDQRVDLETSELPQI
nr:unnamed protein product [Spirometra erinaceieuropaei]